MMPLSFVFYFLLLFKLCTDFFFDKVCSQSYSQKLPISISLHGFAVGKRGRQGRELKDNGSSEDWCAGYLSVH